MELLPDRHRMTHLLARFRPEIRTAIASQYKLPSSRSALISLARRIEDNVRLNPATTMGPPPAIQPAQGPAQGTRSNQRASGPPPTPRLQPADAPTSATAPTAGPAPRGIKRGACNRCGGLGHWAAECTAQMPGGPATTAPALRPPALCRICGTEGHISSNCPDAVCALCRREGRNHRGHTTAACQWGQPQQQPPQAQPPQQRGGGQGAAQNPATTVNAAPVANSSARRE